MDKNIWPKRERVKTYIHTHIHTYTLTKREREREKKQHIFFNNLCDVCLWCCVGSGKCGRVCGRCFFFFFFFFFIWCWGVKRKGVKLRDYFIGVFVW